MFDVCSCDCVDRPATPTETHSQPRHAICIFQFGLFAICLWLSFSSSVQAQAVDKTVASVTNGSQATPDVITYSDLIWQLALEPGRAFTAQPSSQDLNEVLKTLEDQLLVLQEARKLPLALTPDAQKDFDASVKKKRDELAQAFGAG